MADSARALRLAGTIKKLVARALETEIKDPRLGFVTVTDVRVTGDLQQASVFYTVYGGEEERAATAAALTSAKGRLRSLVGRELGIRLTPTLEFHLDAVPETAASLDKALHEAQQRDEELRRLRENATYAGDEDPYRHKDESDGEDA
ncbi:30S ribosome-binding factor RbfA [uncultured Demequina sp.]|uniref:30S ribosome-binding factor RbfA n=1 Tax=uncultured Demequina sp. TaxID=693499 RepID=UPI0025E2DA33|nr:30S ribosome-binding factor RbfA [uncultured Demequina sp.]